MMTWNLARADAQAWAARRGRVQAVLLRSFPDVLAVQEAMPHQIVDLQAWLPGHHLVAGEADARGERNAVFVDASRYDVLGHGTEPLPGDGTPRAATWVRLRERATRATLTVVNTHFDHTDEDARAAAAEKLQALLPGTVVMGDLNAEPGSLPHRILLAGRFDPFPDEGAETMRGDGPADAADARYDAILVPREMAAVQPRRILSDASDHHALAVDVDTELDEPTRSEGGTP